MSREEPDAGILHVLISGGPRSATTATTGGYPTTSRMETDAAGGRRVVAIDLDSPDIPWECGPAPAPVVVQ